MSKKMEGKRRGGYRPGSGRSYSGYYKRIYCGSTYELCWVIYQIEHKKEFQRFEGCLEYNGKKYFPDFLQDRKIIEIKGYEHNDLVEAKTKVANMCGYEVCVLRKDDLKKEFEYVEKKYTKNFKSLYDNFKPKYMYTCFNCNEEFGRDKKSKFEKIFCSRSCCLKSNRKSSGRNQYNK